METIYAKDFDKMAKKRAVIISRKTYINSQTVYFNLKMMDFNNRIFFEDMDIDMMRFVQKPHILKPDTFFEEYIEVYKHFYPNSRIYTDIVIEGMPRYDIKVEKDHVTKLDRKFSENRLLIRNKVLSYSALTAGLAIVTTCLFNSLIGNFTFSANLYFLFFVVAIAGGYFYYLSGYKRKFINRMRCYGININSMKDIEKGSRNFQLHLVGNIIGLLYAIAILMGFYPSTIDPALLILSYLFIGIVISIVTLIANMYFYNKEY